MQPTIRIFVGMLKDEFSTRVPSPVFSLDKSGRPAQTAPKSEVLTQGRFHKFRETMGLRVVASESSSDGKTALPCSIMAL